MRKHKVVAVIALAVGTALAQEGRSVAELQAPLWRLPLAAKVRLAAQAATEALKLGQPVKVKVTLRNESNVAFRYSVSRPDRELSYLLAVYREDGTAVARTPPQTGRGSGLTGTFDPGEELADILEISKFFDLARTGKYYIRIARRLYPLSDRATYQIAVSDVVTIEITE